VHTVWSIKLDNQHFRQLGPHLEEVLKDNIRVMFHPNPALPRGGSRIARARGSFSKGLGVRVAHRVIKQTVVGARRWGVSGVCVYVCVSLRRRGFEERCSRRVQKVRWFKKEEGGFEYSGRTRVKEGGQEMVG
jgi:hypothetical protein